MFNCEHCFVRRRWVDDFVYKCFGRCCSSLDDAILEHDYCLDLFLDPELSAFLYVHIQSSFFRFNGGSFIREIICKQGFRDSQHSNACHASYHLSARNKVRTGILGKNE